MLFSPLSPVSPQSQAVKVAGKMQKVVTEKRGQIDSLQSKIRWLEECLETSVKVRLYISL